MFTLRKSTILRMTALLLVVLLLALAALPASAQQRTHIVQPGETLASIAARYNTTVAALVTLNNITNPNRIYRGQVLLIPPTGGPVTTPARTHVVQRGDELRFIAARYGTTWQAIAAANGLSNPNLIFTGQVLTIPGTGGPVTTPPPVTVGGRYVVRQGETLYRISVYFGVNMWDIARANGILNLNTIYTGQSLVIPGR